MKLMGMNHTFILSVECVVFERQTREGLPRALYKTASRSTEEAELVLSQRTVSAIVRIER
jgi:hypothetical protein